MYLDPVARRGKVSLTPNLTSLAVLLGLYLAARTLLYNNMARDPPDDQMLFVVTLSAVTVSAVTTFTSSR